MEGVDISFDELRKILEAKGLDIKELAREAKEMKLESQLEEKAAKEKPAESAPRINKAPLFELALVNYPDFVIRKSTTKTEKMMVFMISQNSYYIKNVKKGSEVKEKLTPENYAAFTQGMGEIKFPEDFWIDKIESGKVFFNTLNERILSKDAIMRAIIGRYFFKDKDLLSSFYPRIDRLCSMYDSIPQLLKSKEFKCEYISFWEDLYSIQEKFGLDNARDFLRELGRSLLDEAAHLRRILDDYDFKYESFRNYVLYDAVRMGFADSIYSFILTWKDTLDMQKQLWGRIKEKYPQHLLELHSQLGYKCRLMETKINEQRFAARVSAAVKFEARHGDYVFIAPKKPQDFYDEATAMNNCLASYVDRYAEGQDYIFFMRKHDTPEDSLVTIELDLDGELRQALQACNKPVTNEQNNVIQAWLRKTVAPVMNGTSVS